MTGLDADRPLSRRVKGILRVSGLLGCLLTLPLVADEASRARVAEGQKRMEANDITGAEALFRRAIRADPADADARAWLGVALVGQVKAEEALVELRKARELGTTFPLLDLEIARALVALERHDEAIPILQAFDEESEGLFASSATLLGLSHFHLGKYSEADEWFLDAMARGEPDRAMLHFYRGRCVRELGYANQALDHFRRVLVLAPDSIFARTVGPEIPALEKEIEAAKFRIRRVVEVARRRNEERFESRRPEAEKPLRFRLTLGIGHNSNVLLLGEEQVRPSDISDEDSFYFSEALLAEYTIRLGTRSALRLSTTLFGTHYDDLESFNSLGVSPEIRLSHLFSEEWSGEVGLRYSDIWIDTDLDHFQTSGGVFLRALFRPRFARWTLTEVNLSHDRSEYTQSTTTSDFERDGYDNRVGVTQTVRLTELGLNLAFGYEHSWSRTEGNQSDLNTNTVRLQAGYQIPRIEVDASGSFAWSRSRYRHSDQRRSTPGHRADDLFSVGVGLSRSLTEDDTVRAFANYSRVWAQSNNNLFEYDRDTLFFGVSIDF